jgi:hypothetical protein
MEAVDPGCGGGITVILARFGEESGGGVVGGGSDGVRAQQTETKSGRQDKEDE